MEPIALTDWIANDKTAPDMLWNEAAASQAAFVRDELTALVGTGLDWEDRKALASVISTHRSKSIVLPVYQLSRGADLGLEIVLRNNFYDWKMSVTQPRIGPIDFDGLFRTTPPIEPEYTGNDLSPCYFEGFPAGKVYGCYEQRLNDITAFPDTERWSAAVNSRHALWTAIFLIMRAHDAMPALTWHTKASHADELAQQRKKWEARHALKSVQK